MVVNDPHLTFPSKLLISLSEVSHFSFSILHFHFWCLCHNSVLGDNYAPPRSSTAGRVGTALSQNTDSQIHKYTNIHIQKYTITHSKVTIILLFVHTVLAQCLHYNTNPLNFLMYNALKSPVNIKNHPSASALFFLKKLGGSCISV